MTSWLLVIGFLTIQLASSAVFLKLVKTAVRPQTEKKIETEAFVTPTNPAFVREEVAGFGDSVIVTPKSPQLIEWEENEQLRKMNLRPQ